MNDAKVSKWQALFLLIMFGVMWGGSIPWMIYLAAIDYIPWIVVIICLPIYLLLVASLKPLWKIAVDKDAGPKLP